MKSHRSIVGRTTLFCLLAGGLLAGACDEGFDLGRLGAGGGQADTSAAAGAPCVPVDDNNPCTEDVCDNGVPVHQPIAAGISCPDDGNPCTSDACDNTGTCVHPALSDGFGCGAGKVCQSAMCSAGCFIGGMFYAPSTHDPANACHVCNPGKSTTSWSPYGGTFVAHVDYLTGANPSSVTAADFDGDGKPDLVTANLNGHTVSVLLNTGNGAFAANVDYPTGAGPNPGPSSVTAADLNGDGNPDLAVASINGSTVSVLLNTGNGAFAAKVDYPTGASPNSGPLSVTAADLNGDGNPDLAVANESNNTVSVLLNTGNGGFAAHVDYPTGAGSSSGPASVTAADLDGDGKPDLAVANFKDNTVRVLLNSGNGTFALKGEYPTGKAPDSMVAADLDGDGKPDLAVANSDDDTVRVLLNIGNGIFAFKGEYPTGFHPYSVTAADLDGDGLTDLAVANLNGSTVSVLLNTGNGAFAAKVDYTVGSSPTSVVAADLDGDGLTDLAVANFDFSSVSVLLNTCVP